MSPRQAPAVHDQLDPLIHETARLYIGRPTMLTKDFLMRSIEAFTAATTGRRAPNWTASACALSAWNTPPSTTYPPNA
jgi:hypothetical protein